MNKKNIFNYLITFLIVYLIVGFFFGKKDAAPLTGANYDITVNKEYAQNDLVTVKIKNNTQAKVTIPNNCPNQPLTVLKKSGNEWQPVTNNANIKCENQANYEIKPGEELPIRYDYWNHALFGELGLYKIQAQLTPENGGQPVNIESNEFEIKPQGIFGLIWTVAFYQPIYNALIFLTSIMPNHDLGFAIILLTIIIRTILLVPAHKSMKSQRKLQEIQPKLNKIKEKYKDNQEMIAKETMALWKENKVNPFGSCLPLLIQLPFLIAIFYVIQGGLSPNNVYLLYGPLKDFSLQSISTNFLGILELTKVNSIVLPLIVGGLQFLQMKLAVMRKKGKEEVEGKKDKKEKNEMDMANQMMVYFMPVMIALFTASVPAGVGLYWSMSTLYGTIQQLFVNKQVDEDKSKVRVINKNT